ncbi:hypothetical protein E2P81_ATG04561 [Venturia nashicola]|uniref:C2H2-type domain-containing protein n=1 Tax=Venturia nashicola TaxID=86259 RepID=A0A4Z1PEG7_9PEZI|nr:hypothetical protein E6O75_ATG04670 [Venturia nashicola]TLD34396.1 hypothetical protein E2P81_ATG04561 [Venturia nashicola]
MGPNDQYPYYYNNTDQANTHAQSNYSAYQARPSSTQQVPATQYNQQHARANSASTATGNAQQHNYQDYQQKQQTAQSYPEQNSWYGGATGNYGSQRAAEALSRLGSTTEQTRSTSATAGQAYSGNGTSTGGYGQAGSNHIQPSVTPTVQYPSAAVQNQTQQSYAGSPYGLKQQVPAQARPSSVNSVRSAGMVTQRSPVMENMNLSGQYQAPGAQQRVQMAHHRSASPAQIQASRHLQSLQADQRAVAAVAASGPYPPPSNRVLPNVAQPAQPNVQLNAQPKAPAYNYAQNAGTHNNANAQKNDHYDQPTTIDPSAVYDAWPEHQKRLEAIRAAKALEDARTAAAEKKKAEEAAKADEDRKRAEEEEEAKKKADEEKQTADMARKKADAARRQAEAKAKKNAGSTVAESWTARESSTAASQSNDPEKENAEEQIRQLMAQVKAMNDKHPTLLAKIWEQERQQHIETSQSPQADAMSPPPPQAQQPAATQQPPLSGQKQSPSQKPPSGQRQSSKKGNANGSVSTPSRPMSAQSKPGGLKPTTGTTVWPKEKKGQLAKTAASLLNAIPENAGCTIAPEAVSDMLDRNPTYIELCEMLEALGLKVERATFARGLLQSVPDVNSKQPGTIVPTPSRPSSAAPPPPRAGPMKEAVNRTHYPPQPPPAQPNTFDQYSYAPTATMMPNGLPSPGLPNTQPNGNPNTPDPYRSAYRSPYFNGTGESLPTEMRPPTPVSGPTAEKPSTEKAKKSSKASKTAEAKKAASEEVKEVPAEPATKKDAARKRNFNDLVDLTSLSDDDMPANKRLYQGPPPVTLPGQAYQPIPNFMGDFDPQSIVTPYLQRGASHWISQNGHTAPFAPQYPPVHRPAPVINERHRNVELAQPLNSKKAKKVISYDVKTIARDVLLATGKHPDMLPLNGHLEPLKNVYPRQIDHLSDLTTIRWDILDPGEPVLLDSDDKDSVIADGDADDESDHGPAIPRPAVVRATVGVGGDSGEMMASAHPRAPIKGTFGALTPNPRRKRGRPPKSAYAGFAGFEGFRQRPFGFENGETSQARSGQPYQRGDDANRRRSAAAQPSNQSTLASGSGTPANSNRQFSTPLSAPARGSGGIGYAALRQVDQNGNPVKKKGRPVGWRKNLHQAGVGLLAGGSGDPKMGKKKATDVSVPPPPVNYAEYACKWDGCRARLHNLATLKKHVTKVHGKIDPKGRFTCKWEGCPEMIQVADKETGKVREMPLYHHFPNQGLMLEHVDKAHVGPIAWKLGDGPPDGFSDANATDSEAYLSDAKGRRVTPRISEPPPSETPFSFGKQKKKTAEQLAREAEDEYRKKKREIGPGVDRGGSRLVTPKRRQGLVDDEDGDEVMVDRSD